MKYVSETNLKILEINLILTQSAQTRESHSSQRLELLYLESTTRDNTGDCPNEAVLHLDEAPVISGFFGSDVGVVARRESKIHPFETFQRKLCAGSNWSATNSCLRF